MKLTLEDGALFVKGEMTDIYEVIPRRVTDSMFLEVDLVPNEYAENNGVEMEVLFVDFLNESLSEVLKENGYMVVTKKQIEWVQN